MKLNVRTVTAIFLIIIVAIVMYFQEFRKVPVTVPKIAVVVAKKDIPVNTVIKAEMVKLEDRYIEDVRKEQSKITNKLDSVVGKRTKVDIYKDETVKLKRLIENKPYMDLNDSVEKTEFAFKLDSPDNAYNFKTGDYVDIYIEPTTKGTEVLKTSKLLFEKKELVYLKDDKFKPYTKDSKESIPSYIVFNFDKEEILKVLDVNDALYTFRFSAYGEHLNGTISSQLVEKGDVKSE